MDVIPDFEDMLASFAKYEVKYVVIGGMAFIFHVKPRFTKDMDLWIEPTKENVSRANRALEEFGSPHLLDPADMKQMLQIGAAPARVDIILCVEGADFQMAWKRKVEGRYGNAPVNWIDMDSLIEIKKRIDDPRHKSDVEYLVKVKEMKKAGRKKNAKARRGRG